VAILNLVGGGPLSERIEVARRNVSADHGSALVTPYSSAMSESVLLILVEINDSLLRSLLLDPLELLCALDPLVPLDRFDPLAPLDPLDPSS